MKFCNSFSTIPSEPKHLRRLSLAALIVALAGCGSSYQLETAPVSGRVTLDGKPVGPCTIVFTPPQGRAASGPVNPDGTFTLSTYDAGDGAIVGTHRVAVFIATSDETDSPSEKPTLIPEHYATPASSGLVYEVQPGQSNEFHVELTRKKPGNG